MTRGLAAGRPEAFPPIAAPVGRCPAKGRAALAQAKCGAWETLRVEAHPMGGLALRTAHDTFLSAPRDGGKLGHARRAGEEERREAAPRLPEGVLPPRA